MGRGSARGRSVCDHRVGPKPDAQSETGSACCGRLRRPSRPDRRPHAGQGLGSAACVSPRRETPLSHARRVFRSGILPETEVVPAVWTADGQIQGVSATLLDRRWAGVWPRGGGMDGSSSSRLRTLLPRALPGPRPPAAGGCLAKSGQAADFAAHLQTGASGLAPALDLRSQIALPAHSA